MDEQREQMIDDAMKEYASIFNGRQKPFRDDQEMLEDLLPEVDYKDKKLWSMTAKQVIRYVILALSAMAAVIGLGLFAAALFVGTDGDGGAAGLALEGLVTLMLGGMAAMIAATDRTGCRR